MKHFNIASALIEMSNLRPDAIAIAFPEKNSLDKNGITRYRELTFKALAFETACMARGLVNAGFVRGDRVIVMVTPGFDFFVLGFSMLGTGIVPVFIDPGIGIIKLKKCITEAQPVGFIGETKAHIARVLLGWGKKSIRKNITLGRRLFWSGKNMRSIRNFDRSDGPAPFYVAEADDMAAIIFTSGSTGIPKGVFYSHGNFRAQLEMIRDTFDFLPGEINMPTFPLFALFNPAMGMSSIIPDMDARKPAAVNPQNIIGPIKQFGIKNMFASPALIDKVGRFGEEHGIKLPSLNKVISAGGPASTKALMRFSSMLFDEIQIFTPYGSTEAMPVTKIGSHQILKETQMQIGNGAGVCIGKAVKGMTISIISISEEEIPNWSDDLEVSRGEIGEIVVKGLNVTRSYYNRQNDTKLAKIQDGMEVRHRMGDLGYFDKDGDLWFCGRKAHRVKVGDQELYSIQCEEIFNKHPDVFRSALVGANDQAVLCVEIEKTGNHINQAKLRSELLEWAAANSLTAVIKTVLFHNRFPVDRRHNTKIIREELAVWAKHKLQ